MEMCVLSSGSRANSLFLRSSGYSLLVDCGLSAKEAAKRLALMGVSLRDLQAVVVTHEHNDHVAGIPVVTRNSQALVYATEATFGASRHLADVQEARRVVFHPETQFEVGPFSFLPIRVRHDAIEPVAFRVSNGECHLGVVTDLGEIPYGLVEKLSGLDALIIEANHDPLLLDACPYPWELKQRIRSERGHLSNEQAGEIVSGVSRLDGHRMQAVIAAHISEKSNDPSLAVEALRLAWVNESNRPHFLAASPNSATQLFDLAAGLVGRQSLADSIERTALVRRDSESELALDKDPYSMSKTGTRKPNLLVGDIPF